MDAVRGSAPEPAFPADDAAASASAAMSGRDEIGAATVCTAVPNLSAATSSAASSASTSTHCTRRPRSRSVRRASNHRMELPVSAPTSMTTNGRSVSTVSARVASDLAASSRSGSACFRAASSKGTLRSNHPGSAAVMRLSPGPPERRARCAPCHSTRAQRTHGFHQPLRRVRLGQPRRSTTAPAGLPRLRRPAPVHDQRPAPLAPRCLR